MGKAQLTVPGVAVDERHDKQNDLECLYVCGHEKKKKKKKRKEEMMLYEGNLNQPSSIPTVQISIQLNQNVYVERSQR
jgi:hypothetical protein